MSSVLTKQFKKLRKIFKLSDVVLVVKHYLSDLHTRLALPCQATALNAGETAEDKLHCTSVRAEEIMKHAECQLFVYVLLLMKLIDDGDVKNAKNFGDFVFLRLNNVAMKTLDTMAAKALYFTSIAYEKCGQLTSLRPAVFAYYKQCCLSHDQIGQATSMNIIIRSFLQQNLYEQARSFIELTQFPEQSSNNQYARYLYYVGKIKAVQLEYTDAQASLIQSLRKGPEIGATGFRVTVQKLLVIVELLMGEIPNRQIFSHTDYEKPLGPYFSIVSCVKSGDMERFKHLCVKYAKLFKADRNLSLIHRLQYCVLKFGLKKINISYSRISIADIQQKLGLESLEETEQVVAKAIRDGVIDATLNHENQWMQSLQLQDVYTSNDPQTILNRRIKFCMDLHSDAVKAQVFPPTEDKRDFGDLDDEKTNKEEDLMARLLEDMLGDGDDY